MLPSTKQEQTMSAEMVAKFGKRLTEGYDVTHDDISVLGDQERHKCSMWKAWKGTKLQEQSENSQTSCRPKEQALNEAEKNQMLRVMLLVHHQVLPLILCQVRTMLYFVMKKRFVGLFLSFMN